MPRGSGQTARMLPHVLPRDAHGLTLASRVHSLALDSALRREHRSGHLVRIRRGVYAAAAVHEGRGAAERYLDRAYAVGLQRREPIFAGFTAAVLHGLPVVGGFPEEIFVYAGGSSGRRRNGVVEIPRREGEEIVEIDGSQASSLADTLIEVARRMPLLSALVMADAALAQPRFGSSTPRCTLDQLRAKYGERLPFRSSCAVAAVLERTTSSADTPLETVSRLRIEELGYPTPLLQHAVHLPGRARPVFLDFAWPDQGVWGEADGLGKYAASDSVDARGAAESVIAEKRREDEIRLATGWRCARWEWRDAWHSDRLDAILRRVGLVCG